MNDFLGALEKDNLILPLYGSEAVYFDADWTPSYKQEENSILLAYYDQEQEMYILKPFEKLCVFLESGQPLGTKSYYIPRNTCVYSDKASAVRFV